MVSFQCDACQDVVKKPKLDSHGARCHASFTCIDCSKTFAGPAQWKSHTSCISEEQKYHKSVYQEPRGRGRGRGQRGGRGGRGGGRMPYAGSGENAVPLGPQVNSWTAPPPDPVNNSPFDSSEWTASGDKAPADAQAPTTTTGEASESEKKSKKSKKRKAEEVETAEPAPDAAPTIEEPAKKKKKKQADEPVSESTADSAVQPETKDKKKKKSRKSEAGNEDTLTAQNGLLNPDTIVADAEAVPTEQKAKKEKKEKKSKKSRKAEVTEEGISSNVNDLSTTQSNNEAPAMVPLATFVNNNAHPPTTVIEESSPKEKYKSNGVVTEPGASNGVETVNGHGKSGKREKSGKKDKEGKKDKKKDKKSNGTDRAPLVGEMATSESTVPKEPQSDTNDLIPISTIEANNGKKEKKAKKEKKPKVPDALPTSESASEQAENPTVEPKKSKKRKPKDEPNACEVTVPSDFVSSGTFKSGEKSKKSKRRDKAAEANVAA